MRNDVTILDESGIVTRNFLNIALPTINFRHCIHSADIVLFLWSQFKVSAMSNVTSNTDADVQPDHQKCWTDERVRATLEQEGLCNISERILFDAKRNLNWDMDVKNVIRIACIDAQREAQTALQKVQTALQTAQEINLAERLQRTKDADQQTALQKVQTALQTAQDINLAERLQRTKDADQEKQQLMTSLPLNNTMCINSHMHHVHM